MRNKFKLKKGFWKDKRIQIALFAVMVLFIGVTAQIMMKTFMKEKVQISEVFMDSQVIATKSSLEMAGRYMTKSLTKEQKRQVIETITNEIGLVFGAEELIWQEEEKVAQVSLHRESKAADTKIQLVSMNVNEEGEIPIIQNYILIHMELYDHIEQIVDYKKLLQDCFHVLEMSEESASIQFIGKYPGALTLDSKNVIADQMIDQLNGHITYENRADDLYTVYAYSGSIAEHISVGKSKVNIQVAMNYNEELNETMVYLATPIMNGSY